MATVWCTQRLMGQRMRQQPGLVQWPGATGTRSGGQGGEFEYTCKGRGMCMWWHGEAGRVGFVHMLVVRG